MKRGVNGRMGNEREGKRIRDGKLKSMKGKYVDSGMREREGKEGNARGNLWL